MNSQIKSNRMKVLVFVSLIAVLLLGSIGATSVAAKSAIPGDALYSLKTTMEQTQLKLSKDAANRAQLKISFAEERLEEISKLVNEGRYLEIEKTVLAFESAINGALFELEAVTKTDPTQAALLATEITSALSKYAEVLTVLAVSVPEVIQAEVNRALDSALLAGSLDMSDDDDMNSNDNDDDMNSNDDDDDMNSNDDDMNSNDDDDDSNSNDDDMNSNDDDDDDDSNSNDDDMNSNDDDDDDDSNSNDDDMNSNDDDDDSNSNDDDDDSNSNDDDSNSNDDDSNSNDDDSSDDDSSDDDNSNDDSSDDDNSNDDSDDDSNDSFDD